MGILSNSSTKTNSSRGGYERVFMGFGINAVTGPDVPCRECYVMGNISNTSNVRMNIGAVATSVNGMIIPQPVFGVFTIAVISSSIPQPMLVKIDNLNELQFWANSFCKVDILYRK